MTPPPASRARRRKCLVKHPKRSKCLPPRIYKVKFAYVEEAKFAKNAPVSEFAKSKTITVVERLTIDARGPEPVALSDFGSHSFVPMSTSAMAEIETLSDESFSTIGIECLCKVFHESSDDDTSECPICVRGCDKKKGHTGRHRTRLSTI